MKMRTRTYNLLKQLYGKRFVASLPYLSEDFEVVVTRDDGIIEVSSILNEYACYINPKEFFCSCMDNFVRKTICKHIIATLLKAFSENKLTEFELVNLLVWSVGD